MATEYIDRAISKAVLEASTYFPVICITGPRQSGKSTLIGHIFPEYEKFTMEDLDVREMAKKDPVAFLHRSDKGMVLDEIQQAPELLSYIQGIVDNDPSRKFVISGSSNFTLLDKVSQSLAGRVGMFDLLPMSMAENKEMVASKGLDDLMFDGLYPAICSGKNKARYFYRSYVRTYLERDVRDELQVRNLGQFETFLKLCAGRIGSLVDYTELSNEIGVAVNTIKSWISILETSYVVKIVRPYSENIAKRVIKTPKLYFCDTGLACYLLGIESPAQLSRDKMRGHLFENLIVMEALKARFNQGKDSNIYFYRDSNMNEIDLLTKTEGRLNGYEIKSSMTFSTEFEKMLWKMPEIIKEPIGERAVIYAGSLENRQSKVQVWNYANIYGTFTDDKN
jgi:predicted AAA+ superfamily ATPase